MASPRRPAADGCPGDRFTTLVVVVARGTGASYVSHVSTREPQAASRAEQDLGEQYQAAVDALGQCGRALDAGRWVELHDCAGQLSQLADELSAAASAATRESVAVNPGQVLAVAAAQAGPDAAHLLDALHPGTSGQS
jgi:hypothetical protein